MVGTSKSGLTAFMVENGVTPAGTPGTVLGSFLYPSKSGVGTFAPVTSIAPNKVPLF